MPSFASLTSRLAGTIGRFRGATGGNIAVIFAIVLVPILGFIGAAVDYSRMSKDRSAMQAALDSAALMISKDVAATPTMTAAQITSKAQAYFNALYNRPEVNNVSVTANYTSSGSTTVTMTGSGVIQTQFLNVIGFPTLPINSQSKTTWGTGALRVALSLDNTGSMKDDNKMTSLKSAAKSLITQLSALAKNPGDVYISLIPFAKDVNVSSLTPLTGTWVDFTAWDAANTTTTTTQGACDQYFLFFCTHYAPGTTVTTTKPHTNWTGCVTDRTQDYDIKNTTPTTSNTQTQFPAEDYVSNGYSYCDVTNAASGNYLQPVTPLTYNWTTLNTAITAMNPTGGTNQPIGLAWAWESLTQGAPFNPPAESSSVTYSKVIVHLSDGMNTQDRWYGDGSNPCSQCDTRQQLLCDNIKAAGVRIISIQVDTDGAGTNPVMSYCASSTSDFYMVTSSSQLATVFNQVFITLSKLRIMN